MEYDKICKHIPEHLSNFEYLTFLKTEGEVEELMKEIRKDQHYLFYFSPSLVENYKEEVFSLYVKKLEYQASRSSHCREYQELCRQMKKLVEIGGKVEVLALIDLLKIDYKNALL